MAHTRSKFDTFFSRSMEYLPIAKAFLKQYVPLHLLQDAYLDTPCTRRSCQHQRISSNSEGKTLRTKYR